MADTGNKNAEFLADKIVRTAEEIVKRAAFDKSYVGYISGVLFQPETDPKDKKFGQYLIFYNGTEKKVRINDGLVHSTGERVFVHVFENNPSRLQVEPVINRILPVKVKYNNETDEITEIRKVETVYVDYMNRSDINKKVYEIESKFKLVIEGKGTDNEEVKKLIFPNGEVIEFEGWKI